MFKKSLAVLKNNPLLIVLFLLAVLAYAIPMFFFMPDLKKMMDLSKEIAQNSANPSMMDVTQMSTMLLTTLKIYLFLLVLGVLFLVYIAGYGNMLAAAVNDGKASFRIFIFGIRKFFGKIILSALLMCAIGIGLSIVISICTLPFTIIGIATNNFRPEKILAMQSIIQIVTLIISVFLYPFIELWIPAIFLDRKDGVIACFKNGFRAGRQKYLLLVVIAAVMVLPLTVLYIVIGDIYSIIDSPFYIISMVYSVIITPVILSYLFTIYNEMKYNSKKIQ